jgi:hypothetical protein
MRNPTRRGQPQLTRVHQPRSSGAREGGLSQAGSPTPCPLPPYQGGEGKGEGGFHIAPQEKVPL